MNKKLKRYNAVSTVFIYLCSMINGNLQYTETWTLNQNLKSSYQDFALHYSDY